jgi:polyribonucleotide nucleotidyltransferase
LVEKNKKEEEIDFKVLPDKGVTSINTDISIKTTNGPLEKIIMEKIKNN